MVSLDELVEVQRQLEERVFGFHFEINEIAPDVWADYVRTMTLAAITELVEFLQEVGWKPWSSDEGSMNSERALGELADVLHFVFNVLLAVGRTGADLADAYLAKVEVNVDRQLQGYDSSADKCPNCGRSLSAPNAVITRVIELEGGSIQLAVRTCAACDYKLEDDR